MQKYRKDRNRQNMINEKEIIIFVWNLVLDKIKNHLEPFSGTVCRPGAPAAKLKQSLLLNYIIAYDSKP